MDAVAVRLISVTDEVGYFYISNARLDWKPDKKYRIEKINAFDPTVIHRDGAYNEDTIDVVAIISAYSCPSLIAFLKTAGTLYVEFTRGGGVITQLPVVCTKYPEMSDDLREYTGETSFTLVSRYTEYPEVIDCDNYSVPEGAENYV